MMASEKGDSVCMLIWGFHPLVGGAEMQCRRLSAGLAEKGIRVTVVTRRLPSARKNEILDGIDVQRIPCLTWPGRVLGGLIAGGKAGLTDRLPVGTRPGPRKIAVIVLQRLIPEYSFMLLAFFRLYRLRRRFSILHIHEAGWIAVFGVLTGRALGKKTVIKEAISGAKGSLERLPRPLRKIAGSGNAYAAISEMIAQDLRKSGVPSRKIFRIPNGIRLPKTQWAGGDESAERVVFVGNLSQQPNKGIDVLIRGWQVVALGHPGARLVLIGGGNNRPLAKLAADLGLTDSISFAGPRDNVPEYMAAGRVFVLPSRSEGMSNALLEAMALGMPVVATDISGSQDLIRDGVNGLLVPSEDAEALGKGIRFLLENREIARAYGKAARATIAETAEMGVIRDRYAKLYAALLQGS